MKITMKHYYYFGDREKTAGSFGKGLFWDVLRTAADDPQDMFLLPGDRLIWEKKCNSDPLFQYRAEAILDLINVRFQRVYSCGVGCAYLEYFLKKKNPALFLQCSDFAPVAIERLKKVFVEADVIIPFDLLKDTWVNMGERCLHLFHRIDTEFSNQEWHVILERMQAAGIEYILFLPSEILNLRKIISRKIKYYLFKIFNKKMTFAGYVRSEDQIKSILSEFYAIERSGQIGDLKGYLLRLKR